MVKRHTTQTFPLSRIATFDVGVIARRKHGVVGMVEADVTAGRRRLREMRRDGRTVSFLAWILKSIGTVLSDYPEVHGALSGRRHRVIFSDADIAVVVEREVDASRVPLPAVIRRCNSRTLAEIELELQNLSNESLEGGRDYQLGSRRSSLLTTLYYRFPAFLRIAALRTVLRNPDRRKAMMGTAIVTSLAPGMRFPGWIIPTTMHNLAFGLGAVVQKPRVLSGEVVARDILHLTLVFDHDVTDGAPAGRFVSALVEHLENASALND